MTLRLLSSRAGRAVSDGHALDEIDGLIAQRDRLVWLDIDGEKTPPAELLQREFGFHPLAIEDVQHRHQRPKLDTYQDYAFIVLYALTDGDSRIAGRLTELEIFLGPNYLVTVHAGHLPVVDETRQRWEEDPAQIGSNASRLFHQLFDIIVDDYFPVIDAINEQLDEVEEEIFEGPNRNPARAIFQWRKDLLALRRVLAPMRDVANILARRQLPFTDEETAPYFDDVFDHLIRLADSVDLLRDLLTGALESHLSTVSNRLNEILKRLTAWAAILMTMALLAGIWGMNFRHMPELGWGFGYYLALGIIGGFGAALYLLFRRHNYL